MITHSQLAVYCYKSYISRTYSTYETDALYTTHDDCNILAFTGTEGDTLWPFSKATKQSFSNWRDILNNLRFIGTGRNIKDVNIGRVHRGFMFGAFNWVEKFSKLIDKDKPLYITGHSKGAAEAAQVARLLRMHGFGNIKEVVLFAEPASHYSKSRKHYDSLNIKTTSYINGRDIIQYMPPWGKKSSELVYIGDRGFFPSFKDHFIANYIKALENNETRIL